ncbi:MAG: thioredoxin family protein [Actinomycetes bacterium]
MNQNHVVLITSVLVISTFIGLYFNFSRGKLVKKYANESEFSKLNLSINLSSDTTILLFSTEYCSICPGVKRQIENQIKNSKDISLHQIDAVENIAVARKLHVKSSPTTIFFDATGNEFGRIIGAPKLNQLQETLNKINKQEKETTNAN